MTTNKQDDKALAENQAFIQSLYDDLTDQNDDATEQPSKQLDQHILAAAHQAVAAKPTRHIDATSNRQTGGNVQELSQPVNKRKKMAWYYPVSMAASVLLVVTIVNLQLSDSINPAYKAPLASRDKMTSSKQSESLVASVAEIDLRIFSDEALHPEVSQQAFKEEMLVGESDDAILESELPLIASVVVPVSANKKSMKSSMTAQQTKSETTSEPLARATQQSTEAKADMLASNDLTTATQEKMIAEQAQQNRSLAAKAKREPSDKDKLISKQKLNVPLSPTVLSYDKYKALQEQSKQKTLYWLLQQENDSNYVIELFKTEQISVLYRLNKNSFQLNKSSEDKSQSFEEISYIAEK